MFSGIDKKKVFITYIILSFLCFLFMFSSTNPVIRFIKNVENTVFYPFRFVVRSIQNELSVLAEVLSGSKDYKEEITQLKIELEKYKQEITLLNASEEENKHLKQLLGLRENIEYSNIVASVVARDFLYGYSYVVLNKGKIDGVVEGLPVVSFVNGLKAVVGSIDSVSLFTSTVKTVLSDMSSIGVYLPRSDTHSVVQGLGINSNKMQLLYIDKDVPVQKGDLIYTSADSNIFPVNLLVGSIYSIDNTNKVAITYKIFVTPSVQFNKLSEVFILKPKKERQS